ncbi:MAG: CoA-binding protein [Gammaproteobacteria bacterium]
MEHVAILGASNNPTRYAYKAQVMLAENGHSVYPVSLKEKEVLGTESVPSLSDIKQQIDTVTVYINPQSFHAVVNDILDLKPKRVIFNPGSESPEDMKLIAQKGINIEAACTLVLLGTNQY